MFTFDETRLCYYHKGVITCTKCFKKPFSGCKCPKVYPTQWCCCGGYETQPGCVKSSTHVFVKNKIYVPLKRLIINVLQLFCRNDKEIYEIQERYHQVFVTWANQVVDEIIGTSRKNVFKSYDDINTEVRNDLMLLGLISKYTHTLFNQTVKRHAKGSMIVKNLQ